MAQRNILVMIAILCSSYILIFILSQDDVTNYTIVDTEYWGETNNRLLLNTVYDYDNENSIEQFPKNLGEWKGFEYRYPDYVYEILNADILLSRGYSRDKKTIWMDIINSKTGESFHKQDICVRGAGWTIDKQSIAEFRIKEDEEISATLRANRLDISKKDKRQIMVYWFMFKRFGSNNSVTMVRLSSTVRNNNTDATFEMLKEFIESEFFKVMHDKMA